MKNKILKIIIIVLLIIVVLILELDRECGHIKQIPYFGTTEVEYKASEELGLLKMAGSWGNDSHYPNKVEITCNKQNNECIVEVVDITFNTLNLNKEFFKITEWNKNFIKANYSNGTYLFEIVINRKLKELTRSRYPLVKTTSIGYIPTEDHTKLINGITAYKETIDYNFKELSFINNPLIKIIDFFIPDKNKIKKD